MNYLSHPYPKSDIFVCWNTARLSKHTQTLPSSRCKLSIIEGTAQVQNIPTFSFHRSCSNLHLEPITRFVSLRLKINVSISEFLILTTLTSVLLPWRVTITNFTVDIVCN